MSGLPQLDMCEVRLAGGRGEDWHSGHPREAAPHSPLSRLLCIDKVRYVGGQDKDLPSLLYICMYKPPSHSLILRSLWRPPTLWSVLLALLHISQLNSDRLSGLLGAGELLHSSAPSELYLVYQISSVLKRFYLLDYERIMKLTKSKSQ